MPAKPTPSGTERRASDERYRVLFENSADANLIIEGERFVDCNQATVRLLGFKSKEELLQTHPSELSPEYQSDGRPSFEKANEMITIAFSRGSHRFEWEHKRADGGVFPVEVLLTAIPGQGQQILHVTWREIGDRKQIERELQHSKARFLDYADSAADWFWEMGPDLRFTHLTGRVEEVMGLRPSEIIGRNRQEIYQDEHDLESSVWQQHLLRISNHNSFQDFEVPWKRPDGQLRYISLSGRPFFDQDHNFQGYRGTGRDVTERKQAEVELRHLRNYLSNIIDSMPSVLIGVDATGMVTQWNSEATRATGISAKTAIGKLLPEVFPRLINQMGKVQDAITSRQKHIDPKRPFKKNGTTFFEDVTIYPLIANGIEGVVIRVDDVTERVRIEEMVVQSEKMLSVGGLAAGMAHEINNPLAAIIQTATVLSNRLTQSLAENERVAQQMGTSMEAIKDFMELRGVPKMLKSIQDSGTRAADIVMNMLSFARKEGESRSSLNLAQLIDRTIALADSDYDLKTKRDFRKIEIIREYEENLPLVPGESGPLQQVILNILRNGADAMQQGREQIADQPHRFIIRLKKEAAAQLVRIEIEDNGPGMDEETCRRIFEPFFTTKPIGVGTGLGLSVSYFIITENHGGKMTVQSQPGKGTNFIIRLPY